jgi:hypothetical protein
MERLRLAHLGDRLAVMARLIPMAATLRRRHLRAGQAVAEKQRDHRQNNCRNGEMPHLTVDCIR